MPSSGGTAIPLTDENGPTNQITTMKPFYLIPLLFLSACSTTPKLALRPQPSPPADDSAVRYPEIVRAYHIGRYADPNDDLVMHEQHVMYRVEENTRWDFHPGPAMRSARVAAARRGVRSAPVNDAILAEVNAHGWRPAKSWRRPKPCRRRWRSFKMRCSRPKPICRKRGILRASVNDMKQRLAGLESAQGQHSTPFHDQRIG